MRIRSRLLLLVSAVLLPALVGSAIALGYIYQEEQDFNRASMSETARALALAIDREMARQESVLRTIAEAPSLASRNIPKFTSYATDLHRATDTHLILSGLDGQQVVQTNLPQGTAQPRTLPVERAFRALHGNEVTFISDLYPAPITSGYNWAVQVPVRRDGQVRWLLAMVSKSSDMQKLLMEQRLPDGWLGTILDGNGVVVARSQEPEKFVANSVGRELAAKIAASTQGIHEGLSLNGVPSIVFWARAPVSRWTFLLSLPRAELYQPAQRATALLAATSLLMLGLGVLAALLVARRIARPVESLREAARRLGHDEPVATQRSGTLELDAVGEALADASQRLRRTTADLKGRVAEAVASFEESQRALVQAQKLEALGRLTGSVANGFSNVLQAIGATLHALKSGAPAERAELLERCERAVASGTALSRQITAFGRERDVRAETLDTPARLRDARPLLVAALPANVRLDVDLPSALWPISVDPAQLDVALIELVANARDALAAGGRIVLGVRNETVPAGGALPAGEYVAITVSDNGQGTKDPAHAAAFARQNGGALTLESRHGRGTTVKLLLPRAAEPAPPPAPATAALAGKGRVLLVDDDERVRESVADGLRAAGFEIDFARTADEALVRIGGGERYDAVLTDVVTPGAVSGLDLAEQVRRRHPRTAVVVATGYSGRAPRVPGVRTLLKPYGLREAVEALNAAMSPG
ncbi:MAG TPA: response regulator [Burkholderiales bacterium]|nr:response regulator [Burkholderiales bacterium]